MVQLSAEWFSTTHMLNEKLYPFTLTKAHVSWRLSSTAPQPSSPALVHISLLQRHRILSGDTVVIYVTKEGIKFSTCGDIGTANVVCRQNTTIDKPEEATIIEMSELVVEHKTSTVTISLSSELPVVVEHKIAEMGYVRFYLAPNIEEDEDEENKS